MLEFLSSANTIVGFIASLIAIGGAILAVRKWDLWARLRSWLYQRSSRYRIDQLQEQVNRLEEAQTRTMPAQMDAYRKELEQADAAVQNVRKSLFDLHQSSEHPQNLTTTEELRQQIISLESLVAALVEIDAKRLTSAQDPTPEAKVIIEAAKARRQRNGFSELPPLPRSSSAPPVLPPPPKP